MKNKVDQLGLEPRTPACKEGLTTVLQFYENMKNKVLFIGTSMIIDVSLFHLTTLV